MKAVYEYGIGEDVILAFTGRSRLDLDKYFFVRE